MGTSFRIGLTADYLKADGTVGFGDIGLDLLDADPTIEWSFLKERQRELTPDAIAGFDALGVNAPRVSAATLEGNEQLALVARFGVGYDSVDLEACTRHGVAVTITPDGARRAVALMVITFMLSLAHRVVEKNKETRAGEGWAKKLDLMGYGVTGRTLGIIGFGNIGGEVAKLARGFDVDIIACDPKMDNAKAAALGVTPVDLETLLRTSDFVAITASLTPETRHLINRERLAMMKPTSFLINAARGPIVDQAALTEVLRERRIRGAALDVFEQEPVDPADPILTLDNVIVAPHALCWTEEWAINTGREVMNSFLTVAAGEVPPNIVNKDVLASPLFRAKLDRYRLRKG